MTALARLALVGLVRAPGRATTRLVTLALAVALLAAMLLFIGHSLATMTVGAVRSVAIDWQGPVASYSAAKKVAGGVARQPGVLAALPSATAPFAGLEHTGAAGTIRAGAGSILAIPPGYLARFHTFRFLRGALEPGAVVLDQQLAATLQAQPGDTVLLTPRAGAQPERFRVSGIALVTAPDLLFQPLNPLVGPAPAQPPANIAILPLDTFAAKVAPRLPLIANAVPAAAAAPGTLSGVQWQVQAQADPSSLSGSPSSALTQATRIRNRVERSLPGQIVFVDNLESTLTSAAGDALYAQTLYIMLAVPGAIVALGLAYLAALGAVERDRRDLALLRSRGARRRDLFYLAGVESLLLGLLAGGLGTAMALLAVHLAGTAGGVGIVRCLVTFGICVALASLGAAAARVGTGLNAFRGSVTENRRSARRETPALWQRLYLDLICLVVSGLVYWLTVRTGFSAVVNPDSNPTLSLSVYMFLAPALLWLGSALLLLRLRGNAVAWIARRGAGSRATSWRGFLLASAARRGAAINRGLLVVGLLLAFGVNLGIFTATYDQQARVDAQLTLGSDVVVTAPAGAIARGVLVSRIARTSGVSGVTAVDHSYAYVGPDLQDIFGIDAATFTRGSTLRDSYFLGGTARDILRRLSSVHDGAIVSKETIADYSLSVGDLLRLRVLDRASGGFKVVPFHVVGIVQEFPSAPKDSFMVTSRSYLESVTHDPGPNTVFVSTKGDPVALSARIAGDTKRYGTSVRDIRRQLVQTTSSITTVDLRGISRIEEVFALLLAVAAMALFVGVALAERRQELATMAAVGASLRQVSAFLWSEAVIVLAAAIALAALLGWLLAEMLVAMLQHVFDPPPDHLAASWPFLGGLAGAALAGALAAVLIATIGLRRLPLGAVLREE